ncbi:MAG TPA: antitoxin MazE family protein [Burkholderiales bacterium]|nr:antitoxin MazE family protein [Burkholderiales bacterium]
MKPLKARERMKGYRARKQASGLRLIQLWVPDTRSKRFAAECRRQSRIVNASPSEADDLAFIERVADWDENAPG